MMTPAIVTLLLINNSTNGHMQSKFNMHGGRICRIFVSPTIESLMTEQMSQNVILKKITPSKTSYQ